MSIIACRVCGCTETDACVNDDGPCGWVETDLCSACVGARPMKSAPRDGRILCLLVDYSDDEAAHALQDANRTWTIGGNSFENTGEDHWQFAGWCWTHDHFTEGKGRVIGWAPFNPASMVDQ